MLLTRRGTAPEEADTSACPLRAALSSWRRLLSHTILGEELVRCDVMVFLELIIHAKELREECSVLFFFFFFFSKYILNNRRQP